MIREYYEQYFTNNLDNLDRLNKFIEGYKLPELTQEVIDNIVGPVSIKEI